MRNGLLGILVCGLFLFMLSFLLGRNHDRQTRIPFLKQTPILSLESQLERDRSDDNNNYYDVQVNYTYQIGEMSFSDNNVWWVNSGHQKVRKRDALDLKDRIDKMSMVWYDPNKPADSALMVENEKQLNSVNFWINIAWWLLVVAAIASAVGAIRHAIQFAKGEVSSLWKQE